MRARVLAGGAALLVAWVFAYSLALPWTERHAEAVRRAGGSDAAVAADSARMRAAFTYEDAAGRAWPYPPGFDVFLWLRHARNYERHGTSCDAIVDGVCRDALARAPGGAEMRYRHSVHIAAIVLVQGLWSLVGEPLLMASVLLVPMLAAALGALVVFAALRSSVGDVGACVGAVSLWLTPQVVIRSVGGDNDVWNVLLPAVVFLGLARGCAATRLGARIGFGLLAAAATVLHAVTWNGWIFGFGVAAAGLVVGAVLDAVARRRLAGERGVLVLAGTFLVASVLGAVVVGKGGALVDLLDHVVGVRAGDGGGVGLWPGNFGTVAELQQPLPSKMVARLGGASAVWTGLVGLVVFCLPGGSWRWWQRALLGAAMLLYASFVLGPDGSRPAVVTLLAGGPGLALASGAISGRTPRAGFVPPALGLVWLLAGVYQAYDGVRFIFLAAVPIGIGTGTLVGHVHAIGTHLVGSTRGRRAIVAVALLALLLVPAGRARATLRQLAGFMNDAWWGVLVELRERTPPDAIVNAWWDYGHWIKFVAERRVSVDGSTLRTQVPHWLARALLAEDERETVGLLRMLNCGGGTGSATAREGRAVALLTAAGLAEPRAHALVTDLARRDRPSADETLGAAGLDPSVCAAVLAMTHCEPPPSYLLVSSNDALLPGLGFLGSWDLRRAALAAAPDAAPEALAPALGYDVETARAALAEARRYVAAGDAELFIAPPGEYLNGGWLGCEDAATGRLACPIGARVGATRLLEGFVYDAADPRGSQLHFREHGADEQGGTFGEPGVVFRTEEGRLAEYPIANATHPEIAVLVDPERRAVLVAPPALIRATLTHLVFLEGRYLRHLRPFAARDSAVGERIRVWQIAF